MQFQISSTCIKTQMLYFFRTVK